MVTHSSILAWRIPWTEESSELQSMGSQAIGHDLAMSTFTLFFQRAEWFSPTGAHSSHAFTPYNSLEPLVVGSQSESDPTP